MLLSYTRWHMGPTSQLLLQPPTILCVHTTIIGSRCVRDRVQLGAAGAWVRPMLLGAPCMRVSGWPPPLVPSLRAPRCAHLFMKAPRRWFQWPRGDPHAPRRCFLLPATLARCCSSSTGAICAPIWGVRGVEREIETTSRPTGAICVLIWDVEEHRGKLGRREAELVQFCALICWRGEIGRESCVPGVYLGAMKFFSWRWRKKLTEIGRWQAICSTKNVKRCRSPRKATPRGCRSSQDAATVRPATSAAWCKCCLELLCLPTGDGGVRTQRGQQEVEGDAGSWGTHGKFQNKWIVMVNLRTSKIIMVWTQLTLKNTDSTMPKTLKTGHIILSLHMTKIAYCTWKLPLSAY